jgi:tetratricopeptide (TPR) repeat protein
VNDALPTLATTMPPSAAREALTASIGALDAAEHSGNPGAFGQALAQVARCYRGVGLLDAADAYLQQALRWARPLGAADQLVELLCERAELALARAGDDDTSAREQAREHACEAARLARQTSDPSWEVAVLMRTSDVLDELGEHDKALALQCRALDLITQDHLHEPMSLAEPALHAAGSRSLM